MAKRHVIPIVINYCAQHKELGKLTLLFQDQEQLFARLLWQPQIRHRNHHKHDWTSNGYESRTRDFQQDSIQVNMQVKV